MNEPLTDEQMDEVLAKMRSVAQAAIGEPGPDASETPWGWTISGTSAAQLAHIEAFQPSTVLALLDDLAEARLRAQLTITDEMVKRGAIAMHQITCDTNWTECSHAGPAGCMAIARQVLESALGGEQR